MELGNEPVTAGIESGMGKYLVDAASGHYFAAEKQRDGLGVVLCFMVGHVVGSSLSIGLVPVSIGDPNIFMESGSATREHAAPSSS